MIYLNRIFAGNDEIRYIYSAAGERLATIATSGGNSSLTLYRSVMVYGAHDGGAEQLMYMLQPEGLIAYEEGTGGEAYTYKYFKSDHTGSNRALLAARESSYGTGDWYLEVEQSTDFYPFGLAWEMNNLHQSKYLYGGKELQDAQIEGNMLGIYDFHARYYNPILGRWVDPDGQVPLLVWAAMVYMAGMQSNAMHCSNEGTNPFNPGNWNWNSANTYVSLAAAAIPYTSLIGDVFGHTVGSFGNELLRATAHGLVNGGISAAQGGNFWTGFGVGAGSSFAGSGMSALGMSNDYLPMAMGGVGGLTSWGMGGDPMSGFMTGFRIGELNHTSRFSHYHIGGREDPLTAVYQLDAVIVTNANRLVGSTAYNKYRSIGNFLPGNPKCNKFVYDVTTWAGASPGLPNRPSNWDQRRGASGGRPPTAGQWADPNYEIPDWSVVGSPAPGDVVSNGRHVGIVFNDALTISARPTGGVVRNDWGFRPGETPVFRRHNSLLIK